MGPLVPGAVELDTSLWEAIEPGADLPAFSRLLVDILDTHYASTVRLWRALEDDTPEVHQKAYFAFHEGPLYSGLWEFAGAEYLVVTGKGGFGPHTLRERVQVRPQLNSAAAVLHRDPFIGFMLKTDRVGFYVDNSCFDKYALERLENCPFLQPFPHHRPFYTLYLVTRIATATVRMSPRQTNRYKIPGLVLPVTRPEAVAWLEDVWYNNKRSESYQGSHSATPTRPTSSHGETGQPKASGWNSAARNPSPPARDRIYSSSDSEPLQKRNKGSLKVNPVQTSSSETSDSDTTLDQRKRKTQSPPVSSRASRVSNLSAHKRFRQRQLEIDEALRRTIGLRIELEKLKSKRPKACSDLANPGCSTGRITGARRKKSSRENGTKGEQASARPPRRKTSGNPSYYESGESDDNE
ncbi:hypothetical protein QAD02_021407 [Eretmocerus hayati]|uniref:Uncharacterized protein n=1 Tax=Eretmocerus hayati TaxID=131215 RepID=A0ACC2PPU3_9HYME|nr:hypothetical protein QAD02_021407 [Eretmocerus hayati]